MTHKRGTSCSTLKAAVKDLLGNNLHFDLIVSDEVFMNIYVDDRGAEVREYIAPESVAYHHLA